MRKGKVKKIRWWKYGTDKFVLPAEIAGAQCGGYALHAITKISYEKIKKLATKQESWPTHIMMRFLKKHGYQVIPATLGNMVEAYSVDADLIKPKISKRNVVLIDQRVYAEESTWMVLYGGKEMHSGSVSDLDLMEFINNPIEAAYVVWHESWDGDKR